MARLVCGRWSKWIVLALWVVVLGAGRAAGRQADRRRRRTTTPPGCPATPRPPRSSELQTRFQADDIAPAVIVYERTAGITPADRPRPPPTSPRCSGSPGVSGQVVGPMPAQDGQALQVIVPIKVDADGWDKIVDVVDADQGDHRRRARTG